MDVTFIQKAEPDMKIYSLCLTGTEVPDGSDLLGNLREQYFETGRRQKNRISLQIGGIQYRCAYTIEAGRPLKWKKTVESLPCERSYPEGDSGYLVDTTDAERRLCKRSRFDNHHQWLSTAYYTPENAAMPALIFTPSQEGEIPVILRKDNSGATAVLYPFEKVLDREKTAALNRSAGEPSLLCRTSCGTFYYCTAEEAKRREKALQELLSAPADVPSQPAGKEFEPSLSVDLSDTAKPEETDLPARAAIFDVPEGAETIAAASAEAIEEPPLPISAEAPEHPEETDKQPEPESAVDLSEHSLPEEREGNAVPDLSAESFSADSPEQAEKPSECLLMQGCPFEYMDKLIIESGGRQYYYFGDIQNDQRSGCGRTAMANGRTAYEGGYREDMRDGFGVYYFKSGSLCYAGQWQENRRSGLGVAFSASDGSAFIGKWKQNDAVGVGASFDREGNLV